MAMAAGDPSSSSCSWRDECQSTPVLIASIAGGNATPPTAHCQGHGPSLLEQNLAGQGAGGPSDAQCALFCLSKGERVVLLSDILASAIFMHLVSGS